MSLTPVLSTDEDIGGVHSMQSRYSAEVKRYGICMEERGVHCIKVRRSKSEEILCRLLTTMVEETFNIKSLELTAGKQIMNLRKENAGKRFPYGKYTAKEKDMRSIPDRISGTMRRILLKHLRELGGT